MSVQSHIESLENRHNQLQQMIDVERVRPAPNNLELTRLKKEKLRLKQEISKLRIH